VSSLFIPSILQGYKPLGALRLRDVISPQFSHFFNSYTQSFNKLYGRRGSLFIPNFKRKPVTSKKYHLRLLAYIHLNPVHHGFAEKPGDWTHSSWHAYRSEKRSKIHKDEAFAWSDGRDAFFSLHENLQMENLISVFENEGQPYCV